MSTRRPGEPLIMGPDVHRRLGGDAAAGQAGVDGHPARGARRRARLVPRACSAAAARGWRFELEWRDDGRSGDVELVANSPDSVGYNIYVNLAGSGKPLDPGWRPLRPGEAATAESSSPAAPPTRPASGTRTKRGR